MYTFLTTYSVRTDGWTDGTWHASTLKKILPKKFGPHNGVRTDGWTDGTWHASTLKKILPQKAGPKNGTHGRMGRWDLARLNFKKDIA